MKVLMCLMAVCSAASIFLSKVLSAVRPVNEVRYADRFHMKEYLEEKLGFTAVNVSTK